MYNSLPSYVVHHDVMEICGQTIVIYYVTITRITKANPIPRETQKKKAPCKSDQTHEEINNR